MDRIAIMLIIAILVPIIAADLYNLNDLINNPADELSQHKTIFISNTLTQSMLITIVIILLSRKAVIVDGKKHGNN